MGGSGLRTPIVPKMIYEATTWLMASLGTHLNAVYTGEHGIERLQRSRHL